MLLAYGKITSVNSKPYPRNIVQNMLSGSTCWMDHTFPDVTCPLSEENNIRYRTLSATEIPRFINAATALQTPAADSILLALYTGMRIGEVCTLKWEYWHPDMHQLILPDTKSGHPFTCPLAPPAIAVVQCQQDLMLSKTYIFHN